MTVFIDGQHLIQISQISVEMENGEQQVFTLNEGLAGFSPGSGITNVTINYIIPASGFEFNFADAVHGRGYHTVQVAAGATDYIGEGKFLNNSISQSTGAASEGTVSFSGEFAPFE
jgi:hypothetical protein